MTVGGNFQGIMHEERKTTLARKQNIEKPMSKHQVERINSQRCYQRPEERQGTATPFSLPSVFPTASRVILKNNKHSKRSFFCLTLLKAFHDLYNKNYSLSQAHRPYIMWRLFISSASSANSCTLSHTQSLGPSLVLHPQCLYYILYARLAWLHALHQVGSSWQCMFHITIPFKERTSTARSKLAHYCQTLLQYLVGHFHRIYYRQKLVTNPSIYVFVSFTST